VPRLLERLHREHGRLPWGRLFEPAIRLAQGGFAKTRRLSRLLAHETLLGEDPAARALFYAGPRIVNREYAATLRTLAQKGADAFYRGAIAEDIVRAVRAHARPGDMTLADLSAYRVAEREPVCGGYRFGRNLGLELAFVDLGGAGYSGNFLGTPVTGGKVKVSGFNTSLVGLYPATEKLELFAKAGLFAWEAKASDMTGGVPFSDKASGANLSLGLGANYFFTKSVGARVEWEHFELDPGSAALLSAGIIVKF